VASLGNRAFNKKEIANRYGALANEYLKAAIAANDVCARQRPDLTAPPAAFLLAHSIEISGKGYLLLRGESENNVKKHGHSIVSIASRCAVLLLEQEKYMEVDFVALSTLSDLHESTDLRYGDTREVRFLGSFDEYKSIAEEFLRLLARNINDGEKE